MRPSPYQWVRYAFGAKLPDRYREWVLHDATSRTWLLRHAARLLMQLVPVVLVLLVLLLVLPGSWWVAPAALGLGVLVGLIFGLGVARESVEARLVKQGYPADFGHDLREAGRPHRY
jgi:hypothetical protein